ncbi:metal ABC transporter ATP-binding protein [Helicobacter turcicus]|uniref:Metal ABC transporter ATP-binding protein n=1 Tax=Helicobacter turcicus TaxID=2867412 RepID=A0ABS7JL63_9HELI|nr:metal ABC transporter ATP-binding protein [Helicobacter turcicus]MBX7490116.1 metal ABC transporter ATP-binding protein [Helicobacter turcicus]MBX7544975.1 metal ABC transporter ATP-binding protein [Helicobacter turcicus]
MAQDKIIECKNVKFYFTKERILYNVNWTISKGDFWAIIGPNGGGKSTLARLLVGLLKPSSGEIIRDTNLRIGYVSQNTFLNRHFPITALEVVMMGFLKPRLFGGFLSKNAKETAMRLLAQFNMESFAHKKIGELSGGQRQRILIARALCGNPNLLVLDEPTASIDPKSQKEIYHLLQQINQEKTIIMISHDVSILLGYAKKVLYVNKEVTVHYLPKNIDTACDTNGFDEHFCEVEMLMGLWHSKIGEKK